MNVLSKTVVVVCGVVSAVPLNVLPVLLLYELPPVVSSVTCLSDLESKEFLIVLNVSLSVERLKRWRSMIEAETLPVKSWP